MFSRVRGQLNDGKWPPVDASLTQLVQSTDGGTLAVHLLQENVQLEIVVMLQGLLLIPGPFQMATVQSRKKNKCQGEESEYQAVSFHDGDRTSSQDGRQLHDCLVTGPPLTGSSTARWQSALAGACI